MQNSNSFDFLIVGNAADPWLKSLDNIFVRDCTKQPCVQVDLPQGRHNLYLHRQDSENKCHGAILIYDLNNTEQINDYLDTEVEKIKGRLNCSQALIYIVAFSDGCPCSKEGISHPIIFRSFPEGSIYVFYFQLAHLCPGLKRREVTFKRIQEIEEPVYLHLLKKDGQCITIRGSITEFSRKIVENTTHTVLMKFWADLNEEEMENLFRASRFGLSITLIGWTYERLEEIHSL
jgi:hypothetical protein